MFQEQALAYMKAGHNVFLTGSAGTGKTYVLNLFIQYLREHKVPVAITASTGIAATHLQGTTIHSWSGMGIKDEITVGDIKKMKEKKYLLKGILNAHILIIDEISMLHKRQLDNVNFILKHLRGDSKPFGGMQVIFSGDFFQLPPVSREPEESRHKLAFMSQAWLEATPVVCYLMEQYRQTNNDLNMILNQIRLQEIQPESFDILAETKTNRHEIEPTRLYSHNADVDRMNRDKLAKINESEYVFFAEKKGNMKMMAFFEKSLIVSDRLVLKKGAKVMFLKNNHEEGVVNGSLGIVIDFEWHEKDGKNYPLIQLKSGRKILATPEEWSIQNEKGSALVSFRQVPLRLAWAITVHKSQGMTIDATEMDLSKCFEPGQGYVALSRLKSLDGLKLLGINRMAFVVDDLAVKADQRFRQLSKEAETISEDELKPGFDRHIIKSGGTIHPAEVAREKSKIVQKEKKKSTYEMTLEFVLKKEKLSSIAEARGLTEGTIIGHFEKIKEQFPQVDLESYKPVPAVFQEISDAYGFIQSVKKKDGIRSADLFKHLKGKYDYPILRLALLFIK